MSRLVTRAEYSVKIFGNYARQNELRHSTLTVSLTQVIMLMCQNNVTKVSNAYNFRPKALVSVIYIGQLSQVLFFPLSP